MPQTQVYIAASTFGLFFRWLQSHVGIPAQPADEYISETNNVTFNSVSYLSKYVFYLTKPDLFNRLRIQICAKLMVQIVKTFPVVQTVSASYFLSTEIYVYILA